FTWRTTPTISLTSGVDTSTDRMLSRTPSGLRPARWGPTNASLTTHTAGVPSESCSVKPRPATIGISSVWKYPGLATVYSATGRRSASVGGPPAIPNGHRPSSTFPNGRLVDPPPLPTLGTAGPSPVLSYKN